MTKTEQIFELSSPYNNPYQGPTPRYLFVCSVGLLRSPTAAHLAAKLGYNSRSCGSDIDNALVPISVNLIYWAHKIVFLNKKNYKESVKMFFGDSYTQDLLKSKSIIWNINDDYDYMNPHLVTELNSLLLTLGKS